MNKFLWTTCCNVHQVNVTSTCLYAKGELFVIKAWKRLQNVKPMAINFRTFERVDDLTVIGDKNLACAVSNDQLVFCKLEGRCDFTFTLKKLSSLIELDQHIRVINLTFYDCILFNTLSRRFAYHELSLLRQRGCHQEDFCDLKHDWASEWRGDVASVDVTERIAILHHEVPAIHEPYVGLWNY